jgi:hypothetical protein
MDEETFRPLAEALGWGIDTDSTLITFATAQQGGPPDLSKGWPLMADAVRAAEAEVIRRVGEAYSRALCAEAGVKIFEIEGWYDPTVYAEDLADLLTAPPEVRVRAMLRVLSHQPPPAPARVARRAAPGPGRGGR